MDEQKEMFGDTVSAEQELNDNSIHSEVETPDEGVEVMPPYNNQAKPQNDRPEKNDVVSEQTNGANDNIPAIEGSSNKIETSDASDSFKKEREQRENAERKRQEQVWSENSTSKHNSTNEEISPHEHRKKEIQSKHNDTASSERFEDKNNSQDEALGETVTFSSRKNTSREEQNPVTLSGNTKDTYVEINKERFAAAKTAAIKSAEFTKHVYDAIADTVVDAAARNDETGTAHEIRKTFRKVNNARVFANDLLKASADAPRQIANSAKFVANIGTATANVGRFLMGKETKELRELKTMRSVYNEDHDGLLGADRDQLKTLGKRNAGKADIVKQYRINELKDALSQLNKKEAELEAKGDTFALKKNSRQQNQLKEQLSLLEKKGTQAKIDKLLVENDALEKMEASLRASGKGTAEQIASIQFAKSKNLQTIASLEKIQQIKVQAAHDYGDLSHISKSSRLKKIRKKSDKTVLQIQYESVGGKKNYREINKIELKIRRENKSFVELRSEAAAIKKEILEIQMKGPISDAGRARIAELTEQKSGLQNVLRDKSFLMSSLKNRSEALGEIVSRDKLLSSADKNRLGIIKEKLARNKSLEKMKKGKAGRHGLVRSAKNALSEVSSEATNESEETAVQSIKMASSILSNRYTRGVLKQIFRVTSWPARLAKRKIEDAARRGLNKLDNKLGISKEIQATLSQKKTQILYSKPVSEVRGVYNTVYDELHGGLYNRASSYFKDKLHHRYASETDSKKRVNITSKNKVSKSNPAATKAASAANKASAAANRASTVANRASAAANKAATAVNTASTAASTATTAATETITAASTEITVASGGTTIAVTGTIAAASTATTAATKASTAATKTTSRISSTTSSGKWTANEDPSEVSTAKGMTSILKTGTNAVTKAGKFIFKTAMLSASSNLLWPAILSISFYLLLASSIILFIFLIGCGVSGVIGDPDDLHWNDLTWRIETLIDIRDEWNDEIDAKVKEGQELYDNVTLEVYSNLPVGDVFKQIMAMSYHCVENDTSDKDNLTAAYDYFFHQMYYYEEVLSDFYSCEGCSTKILHCSGCESTITYCPFGCQNTEDSPHLRPEGGSTGSLPSRYCPGHTVYSCPGHEVVYCPGKHQDLTIKVRELNSAKSLYDLMPDKTSSPFKFAAMFTVWNDMNKWWVDVYVNNMVEGIYKGLYLLEGLELYPGSK